MITDIIFLSLAIMVGFVVSPLTLMADVTLPSALSSALTNVQGFISTVDPIFPISTLFICLGILLAVELAIFVYKAIYWLIKKIPMIS